MLGAHMLDTGLLTPDGGHDAHTALAVFTDVNDCRELSSLIDTEQSMADYVHAHASANSGVRPDDVHASFVRRFASVGEHVSHTNHVQLCASMLEVCGGDNTPLQCFCAPATQNTSDAFVTVRGAHHPVPLHIRAYSRSRTSTASSKYNRRC
jgi:L-asparaginase II